MGRNSKDMLFNYQETSFVEITVVVSCKFIVFNYLVNSYKIKFAVFKFAIVQKFGKDLVPECHCHA